MKILAWRCLSVSCMMQAQGQERRERHGGNTNTFPSVCLKTCNYLSHYRGLCASSSATRFKPQLMYWTWVLVRSLLEVIPLATWTPRQKWSRQVCTHACAVCQASQKERLDQLLKQTQLLRTMQRLAFLREMRVQAAAPVLVDNADTQAYDAPRLAEGWKQALANIEEAEASKPREPRAHKYTPEELERLRAPTLVFGDCEAMEPAREPCDNQAFSKPLEPQAAEEAPTRTEAVGPVSKDVPALAEAVAEPSTAMEVERSPACPEVPTGELPSGQEQDNNAGSGEAECQEPVPSDCPDNQVDEVSEAPPQEHQLESGSTPPSPMASNNSEQVSSNTVEVEDLEAAAKLAADRAAEDAQDLEAAEAAKAKEAEKIPGSLNKNLVVRGKRLPEGWCHQGFISPAQQAKLSGRKPKAKAKAKAREEPERTRKPKAKAKAEAPPSKPKGSSAKAKAKAKARGKGKEVTRASSFKEVEDCESVKPRRNTSKPSSGKEQAQKQNTRKRAAPKASKHGSKRRRIARRGLKRGRAGNRKAEDVAAVTPPVKSDPPTPDRPVRRVRQRVTTLADEAKAKRSRKSSAYHCKLKEMKNQGMDLEEAREHAKRAPCRAVRRTCEPEAYKETN